MTPWFQWSISLERYLQFLRVDQLLEQTSLSDALDSIVVDVNARHVDGQVVWNIGQLEQAAAAAATARRLDARAHAGAVDRGTGANATGWTRAGGQLVAIGTLTNVAGGWRWVRWMLECKVFVVRLVNLFACQHDMELSGTAKEGVGVAKPRAGAIKSSTALRDCRRLHRISVGKLNRVVPRLEFEFWTRIFRARHAHKLSCPSL